jgi:hypothetical protein
MLAVHGAKSRNTKMKVIAQATGTLKNNNFFQRFRLHTFDSKLCTVVKTFEHTVHLLSNVARDASLQIPELLMYLSCPTTLTTISARNYKRRHQINGGERAASDRRCVAAVAGTAPGMLQYQMVPVRSPTCVTKKLKMGFLSFVKPLLATSLCNLSATWRFNKSYQPLRQHSRHGSFGGTAWRQTRLCRQGGRIVLARETA